MSQAKRNIVIAITVAYAMLAAFFLVVDVLPSTARLSLHSNKGIPKKIHQIWLGDDSKRPKHFMDHCKELHPDWEYFLWTDKTIIGELSPVIQPIFDSWRNYNLPGAADILRYAMLQKYGGIYIDSDQQCLRPFDELTRQSFDAFMAYEKFGNLHAEDPDSTLIANGVMGAAPNHPFIDLLVKNLDLHGGSNAAGEAWRVVGPLLVTDVAKLYYKQQQSMAVIEHELKLLPFYTFWPYHHSERPIPLDSDRHLRLPSFCVSWWGSTFGTYGNEWSKVKG
ncbi:nucleotide-diphospho-sugar transferase [Obelidium mucronatum]|nr:nucleotide-diphospho-sugar transferase [Obelidium mucronatum]